jgi:predicted MFS family arabinose efflux permease
MWRKVRAAVMFGIACITSPCCTPLIVPLILALLAGSPAAVWLGQNVGWVYGGLTLISVVSLVLGLRWMNRRSTPRNRPATTIELSRPNEL